MEKKLKLRLKIMKGLFAVVRLDSRDPVPEGVFQAPFFSITRTDEELSLVVPEKNLPGISFPPAKTEGGWGALKILGPLDFGLVGILAGISTLLANAGISIFALSTYDTDYVLVKEDRIERAIEVLQENWYTVER